MARARWLFALVLGVMALFGAGAARADVYGLVVGVDDYGGPDDLSGAVADARDVAGALQHVGAKRVILLLNSEARRQAILDAYDTLTQQARAGDTLVVHYAGHGAQTPLRPGDVDVDGDGKDDVFVLGGYRTLKDPGELIVDKEMAGMLAAAGRKGLKILFVADSCHSGGMTRAVKPGVKVRRIEIDAPPPAVLARGIAGPAQNDPGLAGVTFLAAVSRAQEVPEIVIDGAPRGALSWAFARALEGRAANDGAGWVTPAQLRRYIVPTVIALSEGQQAPQFMPMPPTEDRLAPLPAAGVVAPRVATDGKGVRGSRGIDAIAPIKLATINGPPPTPAPPLALIVAPSDSPDLIWDRATKRLDHRVGGLAAEEVEDYDLGPIVAKWAALDFLKRSMAQSAPEVEVVTGQKTYRRGDSATFRFSGARYPYLTLFNLPPNGRVELLYPANDRPGEAAVDWRGRESVQTFVVDRPPFGAEHLVVLFSSERLTSLQASLDRMSNRDVALGLPIVLREAFDGRQVQVGVLPVYTAP